MTDGLPLAAGDARVVLAPATGGAIAQFTFRGVDVLRPVSVEARAAGNARGFSCYPLVFYSNRIANANLVFAERATPLARNFGDHPHSLQGVGWQRPWSVVANDPAHAMLLLDHTQLPTKRVPVPDAWRFDPPRAIGDVALDNVFAGWDGVATLSDAVRRRVVTIVADRAAGFLVVYIPPGRVFLAVEPVTHMADTFNRAGRGEKGTGARILDAGAAFSCTMRISVHTLP